MALIMYSKAEKTPRNRRYGVYACTIYTVCKSGFLLLFMLVIDTSDRSRLRYARVKDVGTKSQAGEHRNERIAQIAVPLPVGNKLNARSVYWFVTTEFVNLSFQDSNLFLWQEDATVFKNSVPEYYLTRVSFAKNKRGVLTFLFPDGSTEHVWCEPKHKSANKKQKLSPVIDTTSHVMMVDEPESESAVHSAHGTPQFDMYGNNTNQMFNTGQAVDPSPPNSTGSISSSSSVIDYGLLGQHMQNSPQRLANGETLPPGVPLVVSILLLVPNKREYIDAVDGILRSLKFTKEASYLQQVLYRQKELVNRMCHVLLLPYTDFSSLFVIKDCLPQASEAILLLENEFEQQGDFLTIAQLTNVPYKAGGVWQCDRRAASFGTVQLNFTTLDTLVQQMLAIGELQEIAFGGASYKKTIRSDIFTESFNRYFLEWTLAKADSTCVRQNVYVCFKYKPEKIRAFTEYAATSLKALGIEYELDPVVVNGSVLVYLRCPSYVTWYILQRKEKIFHDLRQYDLTEICECFVSDIDASIQRPENKEFVDELEFLREQMICDNVAEQPTENKFRVSLLDLALRAFSLVGTTMREAVADAGPAEDDDDKMIIEPEPVILPPTIDGLPTDKRNVLEAKCTEMKKFDSKWLKATEDCYNSDRLRQQLFNFKTDKNAKFAVRVFISSASAGMATNVAKLMRQFNGKSIVDGVHSGLQIANTIVEWNQSGLVHIGELKHTSATAVLFDVQESVRFDFSDEIANKIINFIQRWNVEHQYSSKEYNSHRFVRDFLQETLNVSLVERFKGPLGSYMDHVMKTGDSTPRLISKSHGTMVFKTHIELEEAEKQIRSKLSDDEIKLLKIFHRGFQLQEAAHGKDVSSCCYGLPTNGLEILNDSGKPMKY